MDTDSFILNFYAIFTKFKDKFLELIPNIILSLVVLIIGYLIGRFVKFLVIRVIRYLNKLIVKRFSGSIQYVNLEQSAKFIGTAFFGLVIISTFVLISDLLGLHIITSWIERILHYSPNLLAAILIVFIAVIGGRIASEIISSLGTRVGFNFGKTLGKVLKYLILLTAIVIAIDQIGIEVAVLINIITIGMAALLFGAALAFGLGARTAVSNILATFYVRKMYKVGDQIKIDDIQGIISKINDTSVVIDTPTGQAVIPAKIFNESKSFFINKDQQQ